VAKPNGEKNMSNLERINNKLSALIVALEEKPNNRVQDAVDDCLEPAISDKDRTYNYTYCRKQANRFGYGEYLPKSGSRDADPVLAAAIAYIAKTFTTFVTAGLEACPDVLDILRPKKNKEWCFALHSRDFNQDSCTFLRDLAHQRIQEQDVGWFS